MGCKQCAPQGLMASWQPEQYGLYGPVPSAEMEEPSVDIGTAFPWIVLLGVTIGGYLTLRGARSESRHRKYR